MRGVHAKEDKHTAIFENECVNGGGGGLIQAVSFAGQIYDRGKKIEINIKIRNE